LHLHGLDNEKTLAGLDVLSSLDEQTHDFTWHGCNDLLAAFGFGTTVAASAPCAWINDFGEEFARSGVKLQFAVRGRRHSDFEGLAVKQNGERVGRDLGSVDCHGLAIQLDAPAGSIPFKFNDMRFFWELEDESLTWYLMAGGPVARGGLPASSGKAVRWRKRT